MQFAKTMPADRLRGLAAIPAADIWRTTMANKHWLAALGMALGCFVVEGPVVAQSWPLRPIRMIVPYTPGGYTDFMARTVGQKLSEALGQPIIFENRPGANSVIGADAVAKAAPDGYTFGTVIAAHAVNASLNPKLPYDVLKDFTYVSLMSIAPL